MKSYLKTFMTRESFGQFAKLSAIGFINATVYFSTLNLFRTLEIPLGSRTTLSFGIATLVFLFPESQMDVQDPARLGIWA